jgi:orotate phosphoribosyltransferase
MREVLRGRPPTSAGRPRSYEPGIFDTVEDVEGDRVLLVEDTWISGATALSAAGNLFPNLRAGEYSVCIDRRCVNGYLPPHGT